MAAGPRVGSPSTAARRARPGHPRPIQHRRNRACCHSCGRYAAACATPSTAQLDLRQIRRIRAHYGGTVNDVLLSVVAGALREWLVARGDPVEGLILPAFIPVSRRARPGDRIGGNRLSGYLCELPVGEPDPGTRLLSLLFDLMVTSIPLPGIRFTLDGAELEEVFPLAPLAAGQALVVGLSWYRDSAYFGLLADREGLPDLQRLAEAIQPAAAALDRQSA